MTQKRNAGGRPPLHGKAMSSAERSRKLREERDAAGIKEMKVWLRPAEAVAAQKRFGGKQSEALAAAVRAALAAPIQEADGQITLLSDRMKVDEVKIELKKAKEYAKQVEDENARLREELDELDEYTQAEMSRLNAEINRLDGQLNGNQAAIDAEFYKAQNSGLRLRAEEAERLREIAEKNVQDLFLKLEAAQSKAEQTDIPDDDRSLSGSADRVKMAAAGLNIYRLREREKEIVKYNAETNGWRLHERFTTQKAAKEAIRELMKDPMSIQD